MWLIPCTLTPYTVTSSRATLSQCADGGDVVKWRYLQDCLFSAEKLTCTVLGVWQHASDGGHTDTAPSLLLLEENCNSKAAQTALRPAHMK